MRLFIFLSMLFSVSVNAEYECRYDLNLGVVSSDNQMRLLDDSISVFQVNRDKEQVLFFIEGRLIPLDGPQQRLLTKYVQALNETVPKLVILTKQGIGALTGNLARMYSGLMGQGDPSIESDIDQSMDAMKKRVERLFGEVRGNYFIHPGKLEAEDEQLPPALRKTIKSGFSNTSGILTALGNFDLSSTDTMAERARAVCKELEDLDKLERDLHRMIRVTKDYDLVMRHKAKMTSPTRPQAQ